MRGKGQPRWRVLPLEMLSTCTCYSQLHWRWFGYVSPSYCTTWPSLVLVRFRFLLDHVSGPCCSTCQFSIGTRVVLRLGHVSLLRWTKCRIFIGPHGMTTIPRVSFFYSTMCRDAIRLRVSILLGHVSRPELPMFLFLIRPRGRMDLYHVFCLYWPTCPVVVVTRVIHWFVHISYSYLIMCLCWIYHMHTNHYIRENDFRSTLLHKMTTCIIILNLNQITSVQLHSKPLTEFTYQSTKSSHQNSKQTTCSQHR